MINHLVLSGGAYLGLYELGCLKYLSNNSFYKLNNIKSIHGTSIGGFLGAIICLNMKWDTLTEYFVQRPWHKIINITPTMLFDVMQKKGLFNTCILDKAITPLFKACDIDESITMNEFYEKTGVELYLYTIPVNDFKSVSLSYKSHPDLHLLKAIQMTCALPYIFQPVEYDNDYYIDGGMLNNYPVPNCIERDDADASNILALKFQSKNALELNKDANLLEYGYFLYRKMISNSRKHIVPINLENEVVIPCIPMNFNDAYSTLMNETERLKYIERGEEYARLFLSYKNQQSSKFDDVSTSCEEEVERTN